MFDFESLLETVLESLESALESLETALESLLAVTALESLESLRFLAGGVVILPPRNFVWTRKSAGILASSAAAAAAPAAAGDRLALFCCSGTAVSGGGSCRASKSCCEGSVVVGSMVPRGRTLNTASTGGPAWRLSLLRAVTRSGWRFRGRDSSPRVTWNVCADAGRTSKWCSCVSDWDDRWNAGI